MTEEEEGTMDLFTNVMGRERLVFYILYQRHIFQTAIRTQVGISSALDSKMVSSLERYHMIVVVHKVLTRCYVQRSRPIFSAGCSFAL